MKIVFPSFIVALVTAIASGCPQIISRSQWGARPASWTTSRKLPVPFVVIHHSAGNECSNQEKCNNIVRGIQNYHMDTKKWSDVGYNFVIGGDGSVYEGRGWNNVGAHAVHYNTIGVGICLLGNFQGKAPTAAAIASAKGLIECGVKTKKIINNYKLIGHKQVSATACPGNVLYDLMTNWENWTNKP